MKLLLTPSYEGVRGLRMAATAYVQAVCVCVCVLCVCVRVCVCVCVCVCEREQVPDSRRVRAGCPLI